MFARGSGGIASEARGGGGDASGTDSVEPARILNEGDAEEIEQVKVGADSPVWADNEKLLLKATDELHDDAFISDATWKALSQFYDTEQLMGIVFTAGQYNLVSMALNTFGVQLDEGMTLDEQLRR